MGRKTRTIATYTLYHVTARGNNREALFLSDKDRETYLGLWRKYRTELEFDVYAYVLMTNHVHWLIRTGRVPISSIVHTIHGLYARIFNQKHQRVGHVFQGRFNADVCTNDRYLLSLCRYIHRNPLEAGIVKNLLNYLWSSYPDLCGLRTDPLVECGFLLGFFGGSTPVEELRRWVEGEEYAQESEIDIPEPIPDNMKVPGIRDMERNEARPSLDELTGTVVGCFNITVEELLGDSRAPTHVQARKQFIKEAVRQHAYKRAEVARFLKKDRSLVTKVLQGES